MIRGIDGQVMINKTVDYSRQLSNQMHGQEHNKEFAAQLQKSKVEIANNTVNEAKEGEGRRIDRENNGKDDRRDGKRKRRLIAVQDSDDARADTVTEEEVLNRLPRQLPRNERAVGGSIDINI